MQEYAPFRYCCTPWVLMTVSGPCGRLQGGLSRQGAAQGFFLVRAPLAFTALLRNTVQGPRARTDVEWM